jgi:hypothetical protein
MPRLDWNASCPQARLPRAREADKLIMKAKNVNRIMSTTYLVIHIRAEGTCAT